MIQYKCPKCGATLESPSSMASQQDKCPLCGQVCVVPQAKNRLPLILGASGAGAAVVVLAVAVAWLWPSADEPKESSQAGDAAGEKVLAKAPPETKVPTRPSQDAPPPLKPPAATKPKAPPTTRLKPPPWNVEAKNVARSFFQALVEKRERDAKQLVHSGLPELYMQMAVVAPYSTIKDIKVWRNPAGRYAATCTFDDKEAGRDQIFTVGLKQVNGEWRVCRY